MPGSGCCEFDFDRIYREYQKDVFRFALHLTRDKQETEDLFQETWLRVVKNRHRVRSAGNIKAWILTITMNLYRDNLRKKKVRSLFTQKKGGVMKAQVQLRTDAGNPARALELSSAGKAVLDAVRALSQRQQSVFLLKEIEGLKITEIAGVMQIPSGTVKSLLHRAVKNLQTRLAEHAPPQRPERRKK